MNTTDRIDPSAIKFDANGLIPAICQHHETGQVLVLAFMNEQSFRRTLEIGQAVFWSRSRQELWHKGVTSGNYLGVVSIRINCEENSLLLLCDPVGPTCHTGEVSCYYRELDWESPARN
ncbi:MAG: phosphoribosyl-AMP cyclohydrolase [Chloroflexota bacterium]|mgnify:CR=1 FL=1|jgi:phosphoribosyl-AMP cyclohydrolase|nr:phosphoribosyl-AMP cyclohydrolase [Chloroflexota bacterium]MDP6507455.1 phosphoribosyl-AMP cyclohydrolase [Chloroflexota bacterium]MDP6757989.1 phosphoribosyl-AMP cyclohydrolase [Chloroflexota bacterium]